MNWHRGVILFFVFAIYLLIGGIIFKALEAKTDITKTSTYKALVRFQTQLLDEKELKAAGFKDFNWTRSVTEYFDDFNAQYVANNPSGDWTYYDAVFFSLTVITTIGYGNITLINESGRGFCIVYALIGIPITYLWMTFVGDTFGKRVEHTLKRYKNKSLGRFNFIAKTITVLVPGFVLFFVLPAAVFMTVEKWTFLDSIYYAVVTLSTIGFGDFVAGQGSYRQFSWVYKTCVIVWIVFGLGYLSMIFNLISKGMKSKKMKKMEALFTTLQNTETAFKSQVSYIVQSINKFKPENAPAIENGPIGDKSVSCSLEEQILEQEEEERNRIDDSPLHVQETSNYLFKMAIAMAAEEKKARKTSVGRGPPSAHALSPSQMRRILGSNLHSQLNHTEEQGPSQTGPSSSLSLAARAKNRINRVHSVF